MENWCEIYNCECNLAMEEIRLTGHCPYETIECAGEIDDELITRIELSEWTHCEMYPEQCNKDSQWCKICSRYKTCYE